MTDSDNSTGDDVRSALIAKIEAIYPQYKDSPALVHTVEVGSNDDLRRYLALAEATADMPPHEPTPWTGPVPQPELTPEESRERFRRVLTTRTGNELPPNRYVLASEECAGFYTGPDWVPFNLWGLFEFAYGSPTVKECARKLIFSEAAKGIWSAVAERYDRPDGIAYALPIQCAEALDRWQATPKVKPSEFKEARDKLRRNAEQLATEVERFFDRHGGDTEDRGGSNFTLLLSEEEQTDLAQRIRWHNHGIANRALGESGTRRRDWNGGEDVPTHDTWELLLGDDRGEPGIVPNLPEMLRRIGTLFAEDGDVAPLQRPNAVNTKRNYFVRYLIGYFRHRHGEFSPTLIANITSIFFDEGISDNDVSKQVGYLPDGRKLPRQGETSP